MRHIRVVMIVMRAVMTVRLDDRRADLVAGEVFVRRQCGAGVDHAERRVEGIL